MQITSGISWSRKHQEVITDSHTLNAIKNEVSQKCHENKKKGFASFDIREKTYFIRVDHDGKYIVKRDWSQENLLKRAFIKPFSGRFSDKLADMLNKPLGGTPFKKELAEAVDKKNQARHGEASVTLAKKWGVDDLSSVAAIHRALGKEVPLDQVFLHRNCDAQFLDLKHKTTSNNPRAIATIVDSHRLEFKEDRFYEHSFGKKILSSNIEASLLPHGGVNFIVSDKKKIHNGYGDSKAKSIICSLHDVIALGGRVYYDSGAIVSNAVIVEMPQNISLPFKMVR
ncbi:hypothetical protein [Iodobacter ciconiae]|uniref:Uncharacterized protein n=1 Tax=Iodobacter ciconiae TaxID=2496266 RepID=A0A3S8ZSS3_9NEIS|nr:hypothetical protein [Iodobacter ciconiae]AZN36518.1 hypothetical protein EJO50_08435 [Iodobacter ciconiae]